MHAVHTRSVVVVHDVDSYVLPVHDAVQEVHEVAPAAEYFSLAHAVQFAAVVPVFPAVSEYVPAGHAIHDATATIPLLVEAGVVNVVPAGQYAPRAVVYVTEFPTETLVVDVVALTLTPLGKLIKTLEGGLGFEHGDVVTLSTVSVRDTVPLVVSAYDSVPSVAA